eukprot:306633-Pelagomonas_calceolata.AAC.2
MASHTSRPAPMHAPIKACRAHAQLHQPLAAQHTAPPIPTSALCAQMHGFTCMADSGQAPPVPTGVLFCAFAWLHMKPILVYASIAHAQGAAYPPPVVAFAPDSLSGLFSDMDDGQWSRFVDVVRQQVRLLCGWQLCYYRDGACCDSCGMDERQWARLVVRQQVR